VASSELSLTASSVQTAFGGAATFGWTSTVSRGSADGETAQLGCCEFRKKRKDYAFRRQFIEKPSILPGCPVCEFMLAPKNML